MENRIKGLDLARTFSIFGMMVVNYHFAFGAFQGNSLLQEAANFFSGIARSHDFTNSILNRKSTSHDRALVSGSNVKHAMLEIHCNPPSFLSFGYYISLYSVLCLFILFPYLKIILEF